MEPNSTVPDNNLGALPPLPDETSTMSAATVSAPMVPVPPVAPVTPVLPPEALVPAAPVAETSTVTAPVVAPVIPVAPEVLVPEVTPAPTAFTPSTETVEIAPPPIESLPAEVRPALPSTDLPQLPGESLTVSVATKKSNKGLIIALIIVLLLVAGVVVVVLTSGLSLFGINAAQTTEQDVSRKTQLQTIATAVSSEYADTTLYPNAITTSADKSTLYVGSRTISAAGVLKSATASDANGTRYCYLDTGVGYKLGAKLSDGTWYDIGTSAQKCSDTDLIFTVKSDATSTTGGSTASTNPAASVDTSTTDTAAQADLRTTVRHSAVLDIATAVNTYYSDNGVFPASLTVSADGASVSVSSTGTVTLSGAAKVGAVSDILQTRYCYSLVSDGFKLGAKLEDGTWYNIGSSTQLCADTDAVLK